MRLTRLRTPDAKGQVQKGFKETPHNGQGLGNAYTRAWRLTNLQGLVDCYLWPFKRARLSLANNLTRDTASVYSRASAATFTTRWPLEMSQPQ